MEKFLGIAENERFTILAPPEHCCSVKLTRVSKPAVSDEAVSSHEIDLAEYDGMALMVTGVLPKEKGWLYEADVIDEEGPIIAAMIRKLFS
jgi:hypothetical protein